MRREPRAVQAGKACAALSNSRYSGGFFEERKTLSDVIDPAEAISALSFEKALAELEGIVARLERGDVGLEESIAIYTRGEALKAHCEALLKQAEIRVEKITLGLDGAPKGVEPLDVT